MTKEEIQVRLWRRQFLQTDSEAVFRRIWEQVRNLVQPPREFREVDRDHWDSIKMEAILVGLQSYNPKYVVSEQRVVKLPKPRVKTIQVACSDGSVIEKPMSLGRREQGIKVITLQRTSEMTLLSWLRYKMENSIREERKNLNKTRYMVHLDDTYDDDDESSKGDRTLFTQSADPSILTQIDSLVKEDSYTALISAVESRLREEGEFKMLKAFRLRLKHPGITNRKISSRLGISRTYTSSYFRRLRTIIEDVIETTDTSVLL